MTKIDYSTEIEAIKAIDDPEIENTVADLASGLITLAQYLPDGAITRVRGLIHVANKALFVDLPEAPDEQEALIASGWRQHDGNTWYHPL